MAHAASRAAWALAGRQHGVIARGQLLGLGFTPAAIEWRLTSGRLRRSEYAGVYAVGAGPLTREGNWLAAGLSSRADALSHGSGGAFWGFSRETDGVEVSVRANRKPRCPGIRVHRRRVLPQQLIVVRRSIPVTCPALTVIDLAPRLSDDELDALISEADARRRATPARIHAVATILGRVPGAARVRKLLDRRTFRLTRSKLERLFLPLMDRAGFPRPRTRAWLNGYEVDFLSEEFRLVVETDGGAFHRTPGQQKTDAEREHAHTIAGYTHIRFTHDQIAHDADYVVEVLRAIRRRLTKADC